MFGDDIEGVPRASKNALCMMKLSPKIVEVLLTREVYLQFLIWIWCRNFLILGIAAASTAVVVRHPDKLGTGPYRRGFTHENIDSLSKGVKVFSPICKSCVEISKMEGHRVWSRVYCCVESFRGLDDDPD